MPFSEDDNDDLSGNKRLLRKVLWERLKPDEWPIRIADLPSETVLVGGSIRDALLDRLSEKPDLDFVVREKAIEFAKNLAKKIQCKCVVLDEERDIARLAVDGWTLDFARQMGKNVEDDLFRRDFRLNAIGLNLNPEGQLIDPTGGINDLRGKIIVAINEKNLIEDPLRILRGFRLMAELDFSLEEKTLNFFFAHAKLLFNVAPERIKYEILKIVHSKFADPIILFLKKSEFLGDWKSNDGNLVKGFYPIKESIFSPHELAIAIPLVRSVYLFSEEGLSELCFSKREINRCRTLRLWQNKNDGLAFRTLSEDDRFQLHKDLEKDLPALMLSLSAKDQNIWLRRWRDPCDPLFHPSSPLDGLLLQKATGIPQGPSLGELMSHLAKEKAFGRVSTRNEAFDAARYWTQRNQPFL